MPKMYTDNDLSTPEDLTPEEQRSWHNRMVGGASCYIEPAIWNRLRASCLEEVMREKARKVMREKARKETPCA